MTLSYRLTPLTAQEVSLLLGVHQNTVKRIPAAELPFFRIGTRGDRRYRPPDVAAFIGHRSGREAEMAPDRFQTEAARDLVDHVADDARAIEEAVRERIEDAINALDRFRPVHDDRGEDVGMDQDPGGDWLDRRQVLSACARPR